MANVAHSIQTATDGIHVQQRWIAANEAARTGLTVDPADVGGVCFQIDSATLWDLIDDSPMTWQKRPTTTEQTPLYWTWATATQRTGQSVVAAERNRFGYQTDILTFYRLVSTSPTRWGWVDDGQWCQRKACSWNFGSSTLIANNFGMGATAGLAGTGTARTTDSGLQRVGIVSAATAGSVAGWREATTAGMLPSGGIRFVHRWRMATTTAAQRQFIGFADGTTAGSTAGTNVDPATFVHCIGVGRTAQSNWQVMHNDGTGNCTVADLGAGLPALAAGTDYELTLVTLTGTSWGVQLRDITTGAVASATVSTDLPGSSTALMAFGTVNNNTDAVAVAIDPADCERWQRVA